jgi:hypothetical protein
LAAALVVRGISGDNAKTDRTRRYLQDAYSEHVRGPNWKATQRSADDLLNAALAEHRADPHASDSLLGPHRLELAARSALPLIAKGVLFGDRGTNNNGQPDRREPGLVIDRMAREERGIRQLHRALVDHAGEEPVRIVDSAGNVVRGSDRQEQIANDHHLRVTYSPAGHVPAPAFVVTATQQLEAALAAFSQAVLVLVDAAEAVQSVTGAGQEALVEAKGVPTKHTNEWRRVLRDVDDAVNVWGATYSRKNRSGVTRASVEADEESYESPEDDKKDPEGDALDQP